MPHGQKDFEKFYSIFVWRSVPYHSILSIYTGKLRQHQKHKAVIPASNPETLQKKTRNVNPPLKHVKLTADVLEN